MKTAAGIGLKNVQDTYAGPEADLWELIMGEQIHIGGLVSSMDLAAKAKIPENSAGIDLCCCTGAGMRFLLRFRNVARMTGVDATERMIARGRERNAAARFSDRATLVLGDACRTGLPSASADFVWGEDAWCYVEDKRALIAEAARLLKPGGTLAFTDWLEGPTPMTDPEAQRFLRFMKFPNIQTLPGYTHLIHDAGLTVATAEDTGRFAPYIELYLKMVGMQLTYDALQIINFSAQTMEAIAGELEFTRSLASAGKLIQGLFVARKPE